MHLPVCMYTATKYKNMNLPVCVYNDTNKVAFFVDIESLDGWLTVEFLHLLFIC